ncbi:MAG TPA: type I-C CRISPR-associated endonuclease Cas1c [Thermomicrobiales bacterium]|nr:type I-C CRISPR-associated endonuclease Cas1c [Thermomicrobiales bacterium]
MRTLLNTLFVQTERSYLHLDHDTVRVEIERETRLRVPLLQVGGIVCFGDVLTSPALLHRCADDGRPVVWLTRHGQFKARLEGPHSGNVLLRRAHHLALSDPERRRDIGRNLLAGKFRNCRNVLLRGAREATDAAEAATLREAADLHKSIVERLPRRDDLDLMRGDEGEAARAYFDVLPLLVRVRRDLFAPDGRSRRPPRDRMNALLSFLYTLLRADCVAALEGVGLDPQIGFFHALRPGRPALALDLMEELRPATADRLALALVNRGQLGEDDFEAHPGGAVYLSEQGRRTVIVAYQTRKQDEVEHRAAGQRAPLGLVPHLQARILARHLRNDLPHYAPWLTR